MAVNGIDSDINMTMWKRADCSVTGSNTVLNPIFPISGGGGGSTDMTATNALLTSIQTNTAGLVSPGAIDVNIVSGGGGGIATNMTSTNNLLDSIKLQIENANTDAKASANNILASINDGIIKSQIDAAETNALLTQIKNDLVASNGGSTDMTATNNLLTSIQANTAGLVSPGAIDVNIVSGGGGGTATDMTATNNLLTGISDSLNPGSGTGDIPAPDTSDIGTGFDASLSEEGVNPDGVGGLLEQLDKSFEFQGKQGKSTFKEIFETHRTEWMASQNTLFSWINSLNASFSSGLPSFNFSLPWSKVNQNIDLNDYSILFDMFRICVLFTATIISYRIVFKG